MLEIPADIVGTVRVVHLLRHPRDILRSQNSMGFGARVNGVRVSKEEHQETVCQLIMDKVNYLADTVPAQHVHRIRLVSPFSNFIHSRQPAQC